MGRIKTKKIKRNTQKIFSETKDVITTDFEQNKKIIDQRYSIISKKLRNVVAGYCTRLKKSEM